MIYRTVVAGFASVFGLAAACRAADIEGVLPASLDQPRIYLAISRDAKSPPLTAKGGGGSLADQLAEALGEKKKGKRPGEAEAGPFAVEAFLDTGASGIVLSDPTATALGIAQAKSRSGKPIVFHDVGVAGTEAFKVADAFVIRTADYGGGGEGTDLADYAPPAATPTRVTFREGGGLMDQLTGGLDVAGMPVMLGKVMVVDARGLTDYEKLRTSLVAPGSKSIPAADSLVPLAYVDFTRFTTTEPADAPRVTLAANPMIGPNPFDRADKSKPITISHKGRQATGTFLLDTGAASSMISSRVARALGVEVDEDGKLTNVPAGEQFMLPIGGIGGTKNVNGFYVDAIALPVARGEPIRYVRAPVLVLDISVTDPKTGEAFTLDGIFGMNYLVASASVSIGLTGGGIDDVRDGAFDCFYVDHAARTLGLKLKR